MDLRTTEERLGFDPERHFLGTLCVRGHDEGEGKSWRSKKGRACIRCKREIALQWARDNPNRAKKNTAARDARRGQVERRKAWPVALLLSGVRKRAKDKGLAFDLTVDHLKAVWKEQEGRCYWMGSELDFETGGARHALRPSLDRLKPELGYVKGNVVWASQFANRARGDMPVEDFAVLLEAMMNDYHTKIGRAHRKYRLAA